MKLGSIRTVQILVPYMIMARMGTTFSKSYEWISSIRIKDDMIFVKKIYFHFGQLYLTLFGCVWKITCLKHNSKFLLSNVFHIKGGNAFF